ncbi:hypothetical protein GCM10027403_08210 [Arthrobacter tecti]
MRLFLSAVLTAAIVVPLLSVAPPPPEASDTQVVTETSDSGIPAEDPLRMWYTTPVTDWESQALVQGNGTTGLMAFGHPGKERLHVNEKTLWRGGPAQGRNYIGGNRTVGVTPEQLESYREALDTKSTHVFGLPAGESNSRLTSQMFGNTGGMGQYQDFGDIYLDFAAAGVTDAGASNYVRDLDLRTGVSTVNFDSNGVHYEREYFVSYPDQVAVVRLSATEPGKLTFTAAAQSAAGLTTSAEADASSKSITLAGQVNDNQMKAEMQLKLANEGGTVTSADGRALTVTGADAVTLVYSTGTNYKNEYPAYRGEDPHEKISERVESALAGGYTSLLERHLNDYQELFSRVEVDLGAAVPDVPTDQLMREYRAGKYDLAVDELAYQFGRYLSISGSRAGDLPTNLCGLWMIGDASRFWGADYHFNVNVQMNYWPAMTTNLAETQIPFNEYVESLVVPGRLTAERSAAVKTEGFETAPIGEGNGFLINTQVNPFGHTAPIGSQEYGWNIGGSSWALQNIYDYYRFTGDQDFLRETAYPMLKEMAVFWNEYLWYSDYQQRLTVAPGVSAEHGPTAVGTAYDQSVVWELYKMAIDASEVLGVDEDLREVWQEKQSQLDPILIGEEGQVKEWFEETTLGKAQAGSLPEENIWNFGAGGSANQGSVHRHASQLLGLFPGTLINKDTPEWMQASIKSLDQRGLNGTGWAKAMKINMYARTGQAEDTYFMVRAMLAGNTNGLLDNLLDSHPPFQIDGNFGLTAGMTEMLVQSQLGYTQFLPALPTAWHTGSVEGLVSRGNFVIDMDWTHGAATKFSVTARNGGTFTGEYSGIADSTVRDSKGNEVAVTASGLDRISFATEKDETYVITLENVEFEPLNVALGKDASQSSTYTADGAGLYGPEKAVDGNTSGNGTNLSNTAGGESDPWWQVDLGAQHNLTETAVWNRVDCCTTRLKNYTIAVSPEPFPDRALTAEDLSADGVWSTVVADQAGRPSKTATETTGRYVRIQLNNTTSELNLPEVEIFGYPASDPDPALANMTVSGVTGAQASPGAEVTLSAVVSNDGDASASAVVIDFTVDGDVVASAGPVDVAAGVDATVTASWDSGDRDGALSVTAVADPANVVEESNEDDNIATGTVTVAPAVKEPPVPDFTPTAPGKNELKRESEVDFGAPRGPVGPNEDVVLTAPTAEAWFYVYVDATPVGWLLADANGKLTFRWPSDLKSGAKRVSLTDAEDTLLGWDRVIKNGER